MIFSRAWVALMRRNFLYRRRNWISSLLEILLPMFFVWILVAIKGAVERGDNFLADTVKAEYPEFAITPLSFGDYLTAMKAERICQLKKGETGEGVNDFLISGIVRNGRNWMVPLVKCNSYECEYDGQNATELCEFAALGLAPSSAEDAGGLQRADDFEQWLYQRYPELKTREGLPIKFAFVQRFSSSAEMSAYVQRDDYGFDGPKIAMGLVWEGNDEKDFRYALRQNATGFNAPESASRPATLTTPDTKKLFNEYARTDFETCLPIDDTPRLGELGLSCTGQYVYNGVLTFQRLVGDYILARTGAADRGFAVDDAGVHFMHFPTKAYTDSGFYASIKDFGPLLVTLGILYPVASMIGYIAREKEMRQKELLKMMSVQESDIGWSWFATFFLFSILSAVTTTAVSVQLYESSDTSYLLAFWFWTFVAVTVFSMMVATFSSKASRAVLVGLLVFFVGVFLTIAIPIDYREDDGTLIGLISLHPVAAFSYGLQEIGRLEEQGTGLKSNTVGFTDSPSGYTFNDTIRYLITDSVFWGAVCFYLNRVIAPDYGRALPLWFPFLPSYWFPSCSKIPSMEEPSENDAEMDSDIPNEPVSDALKRQLSEGKGVEVRLLCKSFGDNTAVDNLNLSMYSGQITALLGHNGAGKTTVINMLTGAMEPTSGHALLAGRDIRSQMHTIRQDIGICLQHDCLFPELTVREHVRLFSRLKGLYSKYSYAEAEEHVDQAIRDVALYEKRNTYSKNLSGGMKRKLSVAMAFCGGSKLIFLDEPTSGMDPFARRFTWNVIRQYRQDRCIILTTHFMDEADILGDRIAIMAEGQLRCVGSSLFLKKHYGVGYQLTIEKRSSVDARDTLSKTVTKDFFDDPDVEVRRIGTDEMEVDKLFSDGDTAAATGQEEGDAALISIVKSNVPSASLLSNVGTELSFQLPVGAASKFQPMLEGLDQEVEAGNITSYGVSITTLDEVFLLVARAETAEKTNLSSSRLQTEKHLGNEEAERSVRSKMNLERDGLFFRHLGALFKKRAAYFRRDKKAWVCTTVLPSIFVCLGFIIFKVAAPDRNLDPIALNLNDYNAGIKQAPRNPIAFNEPASTYSCQPGFCACQPDSYVEPTTGERYHYCGSRAKLNGGPSCSISESRNITGTLSDAGAVPVGATVGNVLQSSESLNKTSKLYQSSQYGAIWFAHDSSSLLNGGTTYREAAQGVCLERGGAHTTNSTCDHYGNVAFFVQYNYTAVHVAPLYQSLADEALVRHATGDSEFNIHATVAPLPITKVEEGFGEAQDAFSAWFLVVLSFPFIAGAFATFIVTERQTKARHLQTVAGVSPTSYWLSTYLWDILNYQIPLWITVMLMFAFDVRVLVTSNREVFSGILTILILYGPASAGFTYCISYAFTSASLCNMFVIISSFLIGMGGPLACFILTLLALEPGDEKPHLQDAADIVTWVCRFLPSFCLGKGLFNAINIDVYAFLAGDINLSAWTEPVLLYEVYFLVGQSVFYICLAILLDIWSTNPRALSVWQRFLSFITFSWLTKCGSRADEMAITVALEEDDDVLEEQDRVLRGDANDDLIVLSELTKIYDTGKVAVNSMSLGIHPGECFGLLGINGAGKTTVMGMLTAEFPPTHGDATLACYSVSKEPQKTRRRIGYCPQFDAHFQNLTGREHVELYASIKGLPLKYVKESAAEKLREVGLSEADSDRLSAGYSGGMKRRLSLACATIGQPQIVFLDECSTGVDPVARREIWQLISDMVSAEHIPKEERTSVILTTHSMEECEALCPRIGIMATGRLRCLGSAQHLKNKFGQGFQIEMKVRHVDSTDEDLRSVMVELLKAKEGDDALAMREETASRAPEEAGNDEEIATDQFRAEACFTVTEVQRAFERLTGDASLSDLVVESNPIGYSIWKDASSPIGVTLEVLAAFATGELRMKNLKYFVDENFPNHVLRERQDCKARYEVGSEGVRISTIFAKIEASKEDLYLSDYGVSQTSLEQVFNIKAAEAERLKQGRDDG